MDLRVLAYHEGKFIVSKELTVEDVKGKQIMINITPVLKYRDNDNVVGALLNIDYSLEDKTVLFLGMVVSIYAENIKELLMGADESEIKHALIPIWDLALGIARGVLTVKTQGTVLGNQFLPLVDLEKFSEVALLVKEQKEAPE